ncbi:MAG: hypothetical protein JNM88_10395 [Chitinophagaceae bacterium]|nr:hypothetical protein [Chitinophagaceae bacterium]
MNKSLPENWLVSSKHLPLPSAFKKREQFFTKQVDFHAKWIGFFLKINEEKFGRNKMALTFALPFKNGVAIRSQKIFESWEAIAHYSVFTE